MTPNDQERAKVAILVSIALSILITFFLINSLEREIKELETKVEILKKQLNK